MLKTNSNIINPNPYPNPNEYPVITEEQIKEMEKGLKEFGKLVGKAIKAISEKSKKNKKKRK